MMVTRIAVAIMTVWTMRRKLRMMGRMMMEMTMMGRMAMNKHWEDGDWVDKYKEYNEGDNDIWNNNNDNCENANDGRMIIERILIASTTRSLGKMPHHR